MKIHIANDSRPQLREVNEGPWLFRDTIRKNNRTWTQLDLNTLTKQSWRAETLSTEFRGMMSNIENNNSVMIHLLNTSFCVAQKKISLTEKMTTTFSFKQMQRRTN